MLRQLMLFLAIITFFLLGSSLAMAQSDQGVEILNQAKALHANAKSPKEINDAFQKYLEARSFFAEVEDSWQMASVEQCVGKVYKDWAKYDEALKHYEQSLKLCSNNQDKTGEGGVLTDIGDVHILSGKFHEAMGCYKKALEIARQDEDSLAEALALNGIGQAYCGMSEFSLAEKHLYEAEQLVSYHDNSLIWAQISHNRGRVAYESGSYLGAVDLLEPSLELREKLGDIRGKAATLDILGLVNLKGYGLIAIAGRRFNESMELSRTLGDTRSEGLTSNHLGELYIVTGEYEKALEKIKNSFDIATELADSQIEADSLENLGNLCMSRGQYEQAQRSFEAALSIKQKLAGPKGIGVTLTNLGKSYHNLGKDDRALEHWENGLEIFLKIGFPSELPGSHIKNMLAHYYLDRDSPTKAESYLKLPEPYQDILDSMRTAPVEQTPGVYGGEHYFYLAQSGLLAAQGRLLLEMSDYDGAVKFYETIRVQAESSGNWNNLFTASTGLGIAFERMGNLPKALEHYETAVRYAEELRNTIPTNARENFFHVTEDGFRRTLPYEGLTRALIISDRCEEALKQSEYTKARIFAEVISRKTDNSLFKIPKSVLDQDRHIQRVLADLYEKLHAIRMRPYGVGLKEVSAINEEIKQTKLKQAQHIVMLRNKFPQFAAVRYPVPMDLSETSIESNEWIIEYHVTDTGIAIYLIQGKNLLKTVFKKLPRKELVRIAGDFRLPFEKIGEKLTSERLSLPYEEIGAKLSDILLTGVFDEIPGGCPLIIIPDDCLEKVPFEMLPLGQIEQLSSINNMGAESHYKFFGDRNQMSYYQSLTALTLARSLRKSIPLGNRVLAMVDPIFSEGDERVQKTQKRAELLDSLPRQIMSSMKNDIGISFSPLKRTRDLGESLKKMDPENTDVYQGVRAKKEALFSKDLMEYRSIIFATHGYFGSDLPGIQEPVLVLTQVNLPEGQDGFLRLSEVMGLKLNCDIAVLTACGSGIGKHVSGEGVMGMGRAFQYAGARSVLISLWNVAERSSVMLAQSFLRHINEGTEKLESLKLARDEIRKQGYDHPYYWAPFILVGEVD